MSKREAHAALVEWVANYIAWDRLGLEPEKAYAKQNVERARARLGRHP